MIEALPAAIIEPDDTLTASIRLPDENDAHVVMTAIRSSSQAIVTYNLKDFPANVLMRWDLEAVHPDDFIIHQLDLNDELIADIVRTQAADLKKPPMTEADLIARLADNGLLKTASRLRSLLFHETLP